MDRNQIERLMKRLVEDVLPPIMSELKTDKERLMRYDLQQFAEYEGGIKTEAENKFREMLEETVKFDDLPRDLRLAFMANLVSEINKILDEHLYAATLAKIVDERSLTIACTFKSAVARHFNFVPNYAVPIYWYRSRSDLPAGRILDAKLLLNPTQIVELAI